LIEIVTAASREPARAPIGVAESTLSHDEYEIRLNPNPWLVLQLACKRALDLGGALALIVFLSPLLLSAAVAIRLSSPGPALFRQERWGRNDRKFRCWKFRTMHVDQERFVSAVAKQKFEAQGILFKPKSDPRVTFVGALLRRSSIDELPQLFNVLMGDMSLVGPRPLMPHMLESYSELRRVRGRMRPGITGRWQISARENNESALQMAPYDLAYVREFSLWNDLAILAKTPAAVMFAKGAY
jgi:lipopolysaccharide/colanic/teichoic acid biosynthesis glycosyltransferase